MIYNFNHICFASFTVASLFVVSKHFAVYHSSFRENFQSTSELKDTQYYHLRDFNKINIGKGFTVEISKRSQYNVSIIGNKVERDRYTPLVKNNTLQLQYVGKEEDYKSKVDLKIMIHLPDLKSLNLNGRTESIVKGFSSLDSLDINVSGKSVATIAAQAKYTWIQVSGESKLFGNELMTNRSVVNISYHSYCTLIVKDSLLGNVSSGANLIYRGNAGQKVILSHGKLIHK